MLSTTGPQSKTVFSKISSIFSITSSCIDIDNMAEQEDTTIKEPRPNNLEEGKEYQKQTKIALQKFTDRIHSFDSININLPMSFMCMTC